MHGKRRKKERVYLEILELVNKGITSTNKLAIELGKSSRHVRRYLKVMAVLGMIKLDKQTGGW
ncbi:MAG: hypothetical protein PXX83_03750 [Candidatus Nitrosotalea sp.]|nr:hypothetical protein [Candidatus Nitrosotalea sp.]